MAANKPGKKIKKRKDAKQRAKRNALQRAADQLRIAELYVKGLSMREIAAQTGLSLNIVWRDVRAIHAAWIAAASAKLDEALARELAHIDRVEMEAWQGWDRSCRPHTVETIKEVSTIEEGASKRTKTRREKRTTREDRDGDPRFLIIVNDCVAKRLTILERLHPANDHGSKGGGVIEALLDACAGEVEQEAQAPQQIAAGVECAQ
jgi:hypothetical protein